MRRVLHYPHLGHFYVVDTVWIHFTRPGELFWTCLGIIRDTK